MTNWKDKLHIKLKIVWTATLWPKWQVVIPKEARDWLDLNPWDGILFVYSPDNKHLWIVKNESLKNILDYVSSRWIQIDID